MESSRRDLLNGMAEHMPILKNNQNTYHPRFCLAPKTGFLFYCVPMKAQEMFENNTLELP